MRRASRRLPERASARPEKATCGSRMRTRWQISTKLFHASRTGRRAPRLYLPAANSFDPRYRLMREPWSRRYRRPTPMDWRLLPDRPVARRPDNRAHKNGRLKMRLGKLVLISAFAIMVVVER